MRKRKGKPNSEHISHHNPCHRCHPQPQQHASGTLTRRRLHKQDKIQQSKSIDIQYITFALGISSSNFCASPNHIYCKSLESMVDLQQTPLALSKAKCLACICEQLHHLLKTEKANQKIQSFVS